MFQDEARFGRINDVRRRLASRPIRPLCQAVLTHEHACAYAAVDVQCGVLDTLALPYVTQTACRFSSTRWPSAIATSTS